MRLFALVLCDEESTVELLGMFPTAKAAVEAVTDVEDARETLEESPDVSFVLGEKSKVLSMGVMDAGEDAKSEWPVLVDDPEASPEENETDYYVLEF